MSEELIRALAEIEARHESVVFDEFQPRDADFIHEILQEIIATYLNELKELSTNEKAE